MFHGPEFPSKKKKEKEKKSVKKEPLAVQITRAEWQSAQTLTYKQFLPLSVTLRKWMPL